MEAPNLLPVLVKLLREKNAGITDEAINKYISYWQSLRPHDRLPCPSCYVLHGKVSPLMALPEKDGSEPIKCEICKEVFLIPVP